MQIPAASKASPRLRPGPAILLTLLLLALSPGPATAQQIARTVLALYDGDAETGPDATRLHRFAEMPLNHLGYRLVYHDISTGMPADAGPGTFDYVLTWFDRPVRLDATYVDWVRRQLDLGARFAVLGEPGPRIDSPLGQQFMALLGLRFDGVVGVTYRSRVAFSNPDFVGFEHAPDPVFKPFPLLSPLTDDITSHLTLVSDERLSTLVTIGPRGGYVPLSWVLYEDDSLSDPEQGRVKWVLNPFAFFTAAFDRAPAPVPDVTTRAGRRIVISHVDGDGWNNLTDVDDPAQARPRRSAEVILDEIVTPHPKLAVSVGVIGGDIDPALGGDDEARRLARNLFAQDNVEVAAHGYTHPFNWSYFQDYDRSRELALIDKTIAPARKTPLVALAKRAAAALHVGRYDTANQAPVSTSAILPRAYLAEPFSLNQEISGALDLASSLAPPGKSARLFQWTGDAEPFAGAIRATRLAGVFNLNGGENRYDSVLASITYLSPIVRQLGGETQVYAPNTNEIFYTDGWKRDYYGQALVAETVARTGAPVRLKPFDLYFHMYSGEKRASLAALKSLVALAETPEFISLRTSDYAAIAMSFATVQITRTGPTRWRIDSRGALDTLRLDTPGALRLDPGASTGVLGARIINDALYVALDPTAATPEVTLSPRPAPSPVLVESSWDISHLVRASCGLSFAATGFGDGAMTWAGLPAGPLSVAVTRDGAALWTANVTAEAGEVSLALPVSAVRPVQVNIGCKGPAE